MRLLLVEDESQLLNAYVKGLKQDGYAIDMASNGEDAVELCSINTYDLTKPFDFAELKARIRALLRRDFISQPNVLSVGAFNIDLNLHQISHQGKQLILTLKEYTILTYLIQNRDRIVSSEELLEKCWNDEADPFSEAMRVHIYALRKKIQEATHRDDVIQTVKGVGYRFNP